MVVDLLEEVGEAVDRVLRGRVVVQVHLLVFQSLDEALDGRVVVRAAGPRHRTPEPGFRRALARARRQHRKLLGVAEVRRNDLSRVLARLRGG